MKRRKNGKAIELKGNNTVVYVRVSTDELAEDAANLSKQQDRCLQYCRTKGLTVVHIVTDIESARSSSSSNRPKLLRMLRHCSKHPATLATNR